MLYYLNLKNQFKLVTVSARPTETPVPPKRGGKSLKTVEGVTGVCARCKGCSTEVHDDATRATRNRLRGVGAARPTPPHYTSLHPTPNTIPHPVDLVDRLDMLSVITEGSGLMTVSRSDYVGVGHAVQGPPFEVFFRYFGK